MRVLFLQPQPCVRALKYAKGLRWALGENVRIVLGYLYSTLNELYGRGDEVFDGLVRLNVADLKGSIRALVKEHRPQIIHSHNAPDLLTVSAIEAVDDVPIVHDVHEVLSLQETGYYACDDETTISEVYPQLERAAVEGSDSRVYATEGMKDYIGRRYGIDAGDGLVFNNYISESMIPQRLKRKLSKGDGQVHIVYTGTLTSLIEGSHYDLREIFRDIARHEMHIHIYVSGINKDGAYERLAEDSAFIHHHGHLGRRALLREITQYDYGWAGFNSKRNKRAVDVILPNKIIEYVAAGLPILAFPHKTIKNFIERNSVGITFETYGELARRLKEGGREDSSYEEKRMRRSTLKLRRKLTIEKNIGILIELYKDLIHNGRQRTSDSHGVSG